MSNISPLYNHENIKLVFQLLAWLPSTDRYAELATYMGITEQELNAKIDLLWERQYAFLAAILNHDTE